MMMGRLVSRPESAFLNSDASEIIDTRFGKIALHRENPITFPQGLLGMPDKLNFFLTDFPSDKLRRFKLLQCIDDHKLSFITLPLDLQNGIITAEDLSAAASELAMKAENMAVLLIVSVQRTPEKVVLSVNARAPLLIDSVSRVAAQHVFQSEKYKVQHTIIV